MGEKMKGKTSLESPKVARVFLRKNQVRKALLLPYTREFNLTGVGVPAKSRRMLAPVLEKLLILQDRDAKRLALEAQLKAVPRDIAAVEQKISTERNAIEAAKQEVRELETKKKLLETEIGSAEDKLAKYRTQQSQVRKNDEYQALGHEIDTTTGIIGGLEEQELEVMYHIDEAKKRFADAEAVLKANIAGHEGRIAMLRQRDVSLAEELKEAQGNLAAARSPLSDSELKIYDRIAARGLPACVPIRGGKCGGCHLKVSNEVESAARGKGNEGKLANCDQCGRIVYWES
jgi:predicted  nucleic acid-binding Zn-ribbon protein